MCWGSSCPSTSLPRCCCPWACRYVSCTTSSSSGRRSYTSAHQASCALQQVRHCGRTTRKQAYWCLQYAAWLAHSLAAGASGRTCQQSWSCCKHIHRQLKALFLLPAVWCCSAVCAHAVSAAGDVVPHPHPRVHPSLHLEWAGAADVEHHSLVHTPC